MRNSVLFLVVFSFVIPFVVSAQKTESTYYHTAAKDGTKDYQRAMRILKSTGQDEDTLYMGDFQAKFSQFKRNSKTTDWSQLIMDLKVPNSFQNDGDELLGNLKHNGAHHLGEVLVEKGAYEAAIPYLLAASKNKLLAFDVHQAIKDSNDVYRLLMESYFKTKKTSEAYAVGLSILFSDMHYAKGSVVESQLTSMAAGSKGVIKKAIDEGLKKIQLTKVSNNYFGEIVLENYFSFLFQGQEIKVLSTNSDGNKFMAAIRQTDFYKSLKGV